MKRREMRQDRTGGGGKEEEERMRMRMRTNGTFYSLIVVIFIHKRSRTLKTFNENS